MNSCHSLFPLGVANMHSPPSTQKSTKLLFLCLFQRHVLQRGNWSRLFEYDFRRNVPAIEKLRHCVNASNRSKPAPTIASIDAAQDSAKPSNANAKKSKEIARTRPATVRASVQQNRAAAEPADGWCCSALAFEISGCRHPSFTSRMLHDSCLPT
jgi:hypothetical protein